MIFDEAHKIISDYFESKGFPRCIGRIDTHKKLFELIQEYKPKTYGEIGSHIGCSLAYVSLASEGTIIHSFDFPNAGSGGEAGTESYLKQSAEDFAAGRYSLNFGDSHSEEIKNKIKENGPYDIFMIDGDHSSEGCEEDFEVVFKNVSSGGLILIDDIVHHPNLMILFDYLVDKYKIRSEKFISNEGLEVRGVGIIFKKEFDKEKI